MSVRLQIAHAMPGRVRVRLPQHRGDADLFAALEQQLRDSRLFLDVKTNPATGSMVLQFAGSLEAVLDQLARTLPFELELETGHRADRPSLQGALEPLRLVSGRKTDPMYAAAVLFGAVGLVQALRGQIMLPALSAFWYAASAVRLARLVPEEESMFAGD